MENNLIKRDFIVGESWVYYKIYCGSKITESMLKEIIKPAVNSLLVKDIIDKWFFIRYSDPQPHIRLRLHLKEITNIHIVLEKFSAQLSKLKEDDLVWKIQLDTYQRELERYGENTIEIAEDFFFHDSNLIIDLLENVIEEDENLRWQIGLVLINNILSGFKYTMEDKLQFMVNLRNGFASEINMDKFLTKQLDNKYRNFRTEIDNLMQPKTEREVYFYTFFENFNARTSHLTAFILQLKEEGKLQVNFNSLVSSYIHMSMVRLFKSKNRLHEVVVYDFLLKYYKTCKAKGINI
ncbi:thiopeptide-type bacteriocin biosynthesis protein [Flavobacterium sp. ABG]|uniref:thiopeptide-type bacteriocin biosynthesis protein n=1 Tax=Flavobacterium sp. ABG TaxID=1423322 RepID=UPI0006492A88|nr:thiopeptide-type bacteriocin biosynthesis protein [Flavobacterium sp. ABG]KLT70296.1 hypothetical protein AB674_08820 [Flavobacterium sp. ABG]